MMITITIIVIILQKQVIIVLARQECLTVCQSVSLIHNKRQPEQDIIPNGHILDPRLLRRIGHASCTVQKIHVLMLGI